MSGGLNMSLSNVLKTIDQTLQDFDYSGAVLISSKWKILFKKSYGYSNQELNVQNKTDSVFRIASITKQITAAAILILVEQDLISLTDPISKYIEDYPNGEQITVHHLLANSSGIEGFSLDSDFHDALKSESPTKSLISMFSSLPLRFKPGTQFEYSISGYLLLGYLIELVSKMNYIDFLRKTIFEPLEMKNSDFDDYRKVIPNRAQGYDLVNGVIQNAWFVDMRIAGGGGALLSTVEDLHRWNHALYSQRVIGKPYFDLMISPQIKIIDSTDYGYGIFLEKEDSKGMLRRKHYHTGGGPGVRSVNSIYPDEEIEIILLSNVNDNKRFSKVEETIERIVFENLVPLLNKEN